jgi:hypothetical protein
MTGEITRGVKSGGIVEQAHRRLVVQEFDLRIARGQSGECIRLHADDGHAHTVQPGEECLGQVRACDHVWGRHAEIMRAIADELRIQQAEHGVLVNHAEVGNAPEPLDMVGIRRYDVSETRAVRAREDLLNDRLQAGIVEFDAEQLNSVRGQGVHVTPSVMMCSFAARR